MNWQRLFEIQAKLDQHIIESKGLQGQDLLDKKILALQVELGELANEWRGFKFWKEDQTPITQESRLAEDGLSEEWYNPLLEEYVDCLHFILSIGNDINFNQYHLIGTVNRVESVIELFNFLFDEVSTLARSIKHKDLTENSSTFINIAYSEMLETLLDLGEKIGFTEEQIETAYLEKNKVNHARQENGY